MISVFTPSHNSKWLDDCYASLKEQTFEDWEWVVLLNGKAKWVAPDDERVFVVTCGEKGGVGHYKNRAVSNCHGEILVELDHDDELMPEALQEIHDAFAMDEKIVFVYSDFAQINEDGTPNHEEFSKSHGWSYRDKEGYHICVSFPPFPHNLGYIWYAPNHVRAFRRSAYDAAGGYDAALAVADDHDLVSRMYEQGDFYHISELLYLQRIHKENTQSKPDLNAKIQAETVRIYQRDIEKNMLTWSKRRNLLAIDLGAAHNKPEGYLGVDVYDGPTVDYIGEFLDLEFKENSVGVVRAFDFLEHCHDKVAVMNKIWRILAHGGMLLSMTPSTDGRGAWQDPTHVSGWNENSFWYYTEEEYRKYVPKIEARFQSSLVGSYFPTEWHREHHIPYVQANLTALKRPGRDFGGLLWN